MVNLDALTDRKQTDTDNLNNSGVKAPVIDTCGTHSQKCNDCFFSLFFVTTQKKSANTVATAMQYFKLRENFGKTRQKL